jgi:3-hydroxyisobutyrate dehydrogenase-like beta-hydroxyacid dehydrogenase
MKIAFIGLGNMGAAMARNLIKAGHSLTVFNRTQSRAQELKALGATVASGAAQSVSNAEVLVTSLADDRALEQILFPPGNAIDSLPLNSVHISTSTISVNLSRRLAEEHARRNQAYVSAPVFGRPEAAAAAKLFVVAAGQTQQIERCQPIFDAIGQKTFAVGEDPSAANVIKLAGNFLLTTVIEGLAEAFALARKSNIDANALLDVLTGSLFPIPVYKNYGSMIAADKFQPAGFKLPLGMKDNRLLLQAAEEVAVSMPLASVVRDRFLAAIAMGLSEEDWAAIARVSFKNAGL